MKLYCGGYHCCLTTRRPGFESWVDSAICVQKLNVTDLSSLFLSYSPVLLFINALKFPINKCYGVYNLINNPLLTHLETLLNKGSLIIKCSKRSLITSNTKCLMPFAENNQKIKNHCIAVNIFCTISLSHLFFSNLVMSKLLHIVAIEAVRCKVGSASTSLQEMFRFPLNDPVFFQKNKRCAI